MSEEKFSLSSQILTLEEQRNNFKKKAKELEDLLVSKNETISKLKLALQVEKFKSQLFYNIITQNTDIKLENVYQETENGIQISNFEGGNVSVIVQDLLETKHYTISTKKKTEKQPGKNFRTIKNQVELVEEKPEAQEEKIKQVEEAMEEFVQENKLDVSYKETVDSIENIFEEVIKNRIYKKFLSNMKEYRSKLLGKLNLTEYTKLIKSHITRLEAIFTNKKYDQKKIVNTVTLSLSSLDQRLVYYGQYYNSELEPDEIQKLDVCLKVNMDYPRRYVPFVQTEICVTICNYSMCLFPVKKMIKQILVNPYGFPNLVYVHLEKSTPEDPFSFYSLEKIDAEGKRLWKMECRLDELSKFISEQLRVYSINLFRKIYFDVFSDNIYREDYTDKSFAMQHDCEQLLLNIIALSKQKSFCDMIRRTVFKYSTIQPSKIDKFNFTRDDPIVKRNFQEDNKTTITDTIKRVFDDISDEDAEKIWQSRVE